MFQLNPAESNLLCHSSFWSCLLTKTMRCWTFLFSFHVFSPLGGAQWSGEQECRRVGSSKSVLALMRSRQEEPRAAVVVHRFALDSPAGYRPMNIQIGRELPLNINQKPIYSITGLRSEMFNQQQLLMWRNFACGLSSHVDNKSITNSPLIAGRLEQSLVDHSVTLHLEDRGKKF